MEKLKIEKIGEKLEAEDIDLESLTMLSKHKKTMPGSHPGTPLRASPTYKMGMLTFIGFFFNFPELMLAKPETKGFRKYQCLPGPS